jgi:nucleotide-binding universal stress UspA family protein
MYKHILIATDGSDLAGKAVATGLELAKALGARVTALTATDPWTAFPVAEAPTALQFPVEEYQEWAEQNGQRILSGVRQKAETLGVACETVHATTYPADAIIETAKSNGCDLIVMASHGRRGMARALLGSQAARVVSLSSIPVLICR